MIRIVNKVQQRPRNIQAAIVRNQIGVKSPKVVRQITCRSPYISPSKVISINHNTSRNSLRPVRTVRPNISFRRNRSTDNLLKLRNNYRIINIESKRYNYSRKSKD